MFPEIFVGGPNEVTIWGQSNGAASTGGCLVVYNGRTGRFVGLLGRGGIWRSCDCWSVHLPMVVSYNWRFARTALEQGC